MIAKALGALAVALLYGCASAQDVGSSAPANNPLVDKPVPSFVVPRLDGGTGSLRDYRGRTVLANVWATWCPPCRHEMPSLQRLSRAYAQRGLVVVGLDQGEANDVVSRYLRSVGVTYPILMDGDQRYGAAFMVVGLPTSVFVRRDGTVAAVVDGEMSYRQMVEHSDRALASRVR